MIAPQGSNIHGPPPFALGLRARVDAFRTYKTMRWWPCLLLFPSLARAQEPVVAVFDLEDTKGVVTAQDRVALGKIIANTLAVSRQFKLVPSQQVRQALIEKKRESYRSCYDESCQIEIGKELAASLEKQASTDPSLEGTMTVEILVQSSGIPSQITTGPDKFKNSVVSECVVTAVRNWKFPTFSGRAMNIDFPVLVRAQ